jgi:AraC-like DNA-binding protein
MIHPKIFHMKKELSLRMSDDWTVGMMASETEMSVSNFQKLFKKEMKTTPKAYLHMLRMECAIEMLSDPLCWHSIKLIALKVGLSGGSRFARDIKQFSGSSPTELRIQCSEKHQTLPN